MNAYKNVFSLQHKYAKNCEQGTLKIEAYVCSIISTKKYPDMNLDEP